ncbi:hypothetical protein B0H17DRAFT_914635 [Mycena rosella]|uniref:Uncharacterized protein n=1 Tax=Mycena rosella TaxID=1033263 RepID=A0AAD7MCK4_MYCRO|nr:hypothetical protein B0H17DRAFT_914635 [Mycena rosella]
MFSLPVRQNISDSLAPLTLASRKETVADVSTVRRHLQKYHRASPAYEKWAKENKFESKLPEDVKARVAAAAAAATAKAQLHQKTLDPHLRKKPERPAPYTDQLFRDAAVEWLAATDQPIDALTHPKFKVMIDIAARATEGVNLPNPKQTRAEIVKLFHDQMDKLKICLHVSLNTLPLRPD